ncbi:MAG: hypothetical protein NTW86_18960 [Candidatus Sumerlaeota bacterium]|nr:hypothetical protein [Candidatus Sumerlaeota bacterium]
MAQIIGACVLSLCGVLALGAAAGEGGQTKKAAKSAKSAPAAEGVQSPTGFSAAGTRGPVEFVPAQGDKARLAVEADEETPWQVSPLIYGTFSEPLNFGGPIYRSLWAQKVMNPSFEPGCPPLESSLSLPGDPFDDAAVRAIAKGEWLPILPTKKDEAASPWLAVGQGEAKFSLAGDAYNSERCQKIEASASARGVGVAQPPELQAWRKTRFHLRCFLRCEGPAPAVAASLYYQAKPIASARFDSVATEWKAFEASFETPVVNQPRNAFLLALTFDGPGTLFVDQVTLTPEDAIDGFDPQAIEQTRAMKTGWIRWPGGNYASGYHWRDGVGPLDKRPTRKNPAWKGLDPNYVGTDEYLQLCRLVATEPYICVNAGNGTAQEAADWVEYCNGSIDTPMGKLRAQNGHPEPYGVKYWNIGNEMWGDWQIGHCTPEVYAERYAKWTKAMRERDPSIRFVACGQGPFGDANMRRWNEVLMDKTGKDLEAVDFHTYIRLDRLTKLDAQTRLDAMAAMPIAFEQALMDFRALCLKRGMDQVRVDEGEYSCAAIPGVKPRLMTATTMVAHAGWLHSFIRQGEYVLGANATEFSLFNPRDGQFDRHHVRYDLFQLYATEAGSQPVRARLETPVRTYPKRIGVIGPVRDLPLVDAVALKDPKDGSLSISLINRDLQNEIPLEVDIRGFVPQPQGTKHLYWDDLKETADGAPHPRTHFQTSAFDAAGKFQVSLPPRAVMLLKLWPEEHQARPNADR